MMMHRIGGLTTHAPPSEGWWKWGGEEEVLIGTGCSIASLQSIYVVSRSLRHSLACPFSGFILQSVESQFIPILFSTGLNKLN